jgi:hypothetical protein
MVTNRRRPNQRVVKFCSGRGIAAQHIKEGKQCDPLDAAVMPCFVALRRQLQLHALGYNIANVLRTLPCQKRSSSGRSQSL